jgi:hypothetical protein
MGIFDMFLSEEKRIQKQQRTLTNRDAQAEDRETAARWLAENGSPKAIVALLTRFDMKLDNQLKDQAERDLVYSLLISLGQSIERPLGRHLKKCHTIAQPIRMMEEVFGEEATIVKVDELLHREFEKDDFKPRRKTDLLVWLSKRRHEGATAAAAPFLEDFDENVRYAAIEVIAAQDAAEAPGLLEPVLANPEEEANRVKVRIAELFQQRGWTVADPSALGPLLPDAFTVTEEGRVRAA